MINKVTLLLMSVCLLINTYLICVNRMEFDVTRRSYKVDEIMYKDWILYLHERVKQLKAIDCECGEVPPKEA